MTKTVEWTSAPVCDACSFDFKDAPAGMALSDVMTKRGPWGLLCDECLMPHTNFAPVAFPYGTGRGQRYVKSADGRWLKVKG